jgi:hypothetical protein
MTCTNFSASVHESVKTNLAAFDDQPTVLHTVSFTDEYGDNKTKDTMAEDPIDAIEKVRDELAC